MIQLARFKCTACGNRMELASSNVRVPMAPSGMGPGLYRERSEYRCNSCGQFHVLRPSMLGIALLLFVTALAATMWVSGISRSGILVFYGLAVAAVYPVSMRLLPASHGQ